MGESGMAAAGVHQFDGETLGLSRLAQLGSGGFQWDLTPAAWERVREGRRIVETAIAGGADYYGVNTGIGSQKDFGVAAKDFAHFNDHVIVAEASNMPGPAFEPNVVRAALAVLINNAATGRLGVRPELVERLLRLSRSARMPEVRKNASSGMSDLTPLAQLALPLVGRSLDGAAPLIEGPYDLAAKEAVSLINCNAFSIAHGAIVLEEARRLIATFDLATATSFEAFRANLSYYRPESLASYRNPHQIASCQRIAEALAGSSLWAAREWRFLQDPLSFRFAMRVNGSADAALAAAQSAYFDDLNCVCDNPVVSLEERAVITGINMDSTPLTAVTDMLRQTLAMAAAVSTERSLKCQNPQFSGLPTGLARPGHADGGIQNLNVSYIAISRQADLRGLAAPVLLDCAHALADGIEDVSGLAPLSVDRTARVIELCWQVLASEIIIAVWAIALRGTPPETLGRGPRAVYEAIRPMLPIDAEGRQVFNLAPIVARVSRLLD